MLLKDARQAVKRLQEGGVPEKQAHAIVDLFVDADEQIATKKGLDDLDLKIDEVEQRLNARIDGVEERLNARIDGVEERLDARIDGVEERLDGRIDEVENRLSQQMEVQEERLTRKIQESETRLLRWGMGSFAALAALLTLFEYVI